MSAVYLFAGCVRPRWIAAGQHEALPQVAATANPRL